MIRRITSAISRGSARIFGDRGFFHAGDAAERPVVDHHATFSPGQGEVWSYKGGRIYLNNAEIEEYLKTDTPDIGQWCHILDSLKAYDDWAYSNKARQFRALHFSINGIQERMLKHLRGMYHTRMGGITLTFGEGALLLNNVNVRALLAMYHVRPTEKARRFLEGMKSKLALILCQHHGNPQVSRVAGLVQALYEELCSSLHRETIDSHRLSAGGESVDCATS